MGIDIEMRYSWYYRGRGIDYVEYIGMRGKLENMFGGKST